MLIKNDSSQDSFSKPARARMARVLAVQAFYQMDLNQAPIEEIIEEFKKSHMKGMKGRKTDKKLFEQILNFYGDFSEKVIAALEECLQPKWPLKRLEAVLRAILKSATAEAFLKLTPRSVLINEYVQITQGFFDKEEDKLINAVLDCICKKEL